MRPGQNKRMRGRNNNNNNNNRKGPNPLTRSYESNGPDVKIRGTAHHIGEKYLQLARDAQSSGDPVMAESYLQHAEHYFRLIAAAQLAQQQSAYGYQRTPTEQAEADDEADDDFDSLPDRFASPAEKTPPAPPPQPYADRQAYNGGERGNTGERQPYAERFQNGQNAQQPDYQRPQQNDRQGYDRHQQDRPQQDRPQQDRPYDNRNGRGDRNAYPDRFQANGDRNQDRNSQERPGQDRNGQDRSSQDRVAQDRVAQDRPQQDRPQQDRPQQDRPARDYDNRGARNRGPREFQPREPREPRQPVIEEAPANGLPAFITAPVRIPVETVVEPVEAKSVSPVVDQGDEVGFAMRPRRRRRPKAEFAGGDEAQGELPTPDPVAD